MSKLTFGITPCALLLPSAAMSQQHAGQDHSQRSGRPEQGRHDQQQSRAGSQRPTSQSRPDEERSSKQPTRTSSPQQSSHSSASNWQSFKNYDAKRPGPGDKKYFPDKFYRDGSHYQPTKITRNTRIYRGSNGRYYCRRSDGTTGLIAGVAIGGILGNFLGDGDSALLSTVLGAGVGGALGREIDRGNVQCR